MGGGRCGSCRHCGFAGTDATGSCLLVCIRSGVSSRVLASGLILIATFPLDVLAQTPKAIPAQPATAQPFNTEQLDALVASIALYPDDLLTQLLMASTFPLEVVAAARWVEDPAHKSLSGDALAKALEAEPWDPSVKSLVPFPVVLATLNGNLTWLQQLGYAFATQQADVFAAVQRLRRLAQANDKLQSSPQQVVSTQQVTVEPPAGSSQPPTQQEVIVIQPAQSDTVYVPSYNPATVYGSSWPYPSYPPYYAPPPPGYYFGTALATGLAFAAGAAVVGGLWGWASPGWGGGYANVNVNRYNNINANRSQISFEPLGRGRGEWAARQFRPRARRTGGPSRAFASSGTWQCGAASDTPGRSRRRGRCRRRWSAGWRPGWRGRCRWGWSSRRPRRCRWCWWPGRRGPARRSGWRRRPRWCWPAGRSRVALDGPGGVGSAGWSRRRRRCGQTRAAASWRRPGLRRRATSGRRIRRYEQRAPGRTIRPAGAQSRSVAQQRSAGAARAAAVASAVAAAAARWRRRPRGRRWRTWRRAALGGLRCREAGPM